jgi:hypothetical protein
MAKKQFPVFDSDSHVVEPVELWQKYLEPEYRTLGKHALWREEGKLGSYLKVNGKMFRDTRDDVGKGWGARPELSPCDDRGGLGPERAAA